MKNQTQKPTYNEMKQSFQHVAQVLTESQLIETLQSFKTESQAKKWFINHLNDRQRYFVSLVDAFTTKGWKHFYGQPLYLKFLELYSKNILFLVDCAPLSQRETKVFREQIVDFLKVAQEFSEAPKPKASTRKPKVSKPKASKPKVSKVQPKVSQPKVDDKLTKLTESVCLLAKQVAQLTELVTKTSLEVAEMKQPKVVKQPKAVTEPKVDPKVVVRDRKTNTKVVVSKDIKPKASSAKFLWNDIFATSKVDHKMA